ncbi:MAG: ABC transporter permease [Phycisphaerales bacterium]|nr:ABC transporter permease [Phycisphaerales bacterium]
MRVLSRAWSSRAARKLRRNRLAVAALAVILVYFFIGLWLTAADITAAATGGGGFDDHRDGRGSLFSALTLDKVEARVGPLTKRGWLEEESAETRARHVKYYLSRFQKALRLKDPEHRRLELESIRLGERTVGVTVDQATRIAAEVETGYRELDRFDDLDAPAAAEGRTRLAELEAQVGSLFAPLSGWRQMVYDGRLALGTDRQGRSTSARAIYSIKVALQIGLIVGLISVLIGAVLGAAAGYYGGWIDQVVQWLYSTLSSVPDLVLLAVLAYAFTGSYFDDNSKPFLSLIPVYAAMCMTFWIGPCRVIRGETLKLKELEYVQAARSIGFSRPYILIRHILPNTAHLMFINFSLLFIAAIKFEVVLSFLGLGVKAGPSWGRMIGEATQEVINGNFWQIGAATVAMFLLVLAFNILSDALQDAFDPKHVG